MVWNWLEREQSERFILFFARLNVGGNYRIANGKKAFADGF